MEGMRDPRGGGQREGSARPGGSQHRRNPAGGIAAAVLFLSFAASFSLSLFSFFLFFCFFSFTS